MSLRLALCASASLCTSALPPDAAEPALARGASVSKQGVRDMEMLSDEALRACREHGEAIALVRVTKAAIESPGTRGEMAVLELAVERAVCGEAPAAVEAWRYTSRGDTLLRQGRKYVVTLSRGGIGPVEFGLGAFVPVAEGREPEAVDAHLAALKRLPAAGK